VVRLRDERRIDDTVLRQVQGRLDIEEVRLAGTFLTECGKHHIDRSPE